MHSNDESKKASALRALAENFGGRQQMSADLVDIWLELLVPYSAAHVAEAVKNVIRQYEYKTIPPFAVLESALDELAGVGEKALELQAVAEWGVLNEQMNKIGYYGTPDLHTTTAYVLRMLGGWDVACQWTMRELDFKRRDFIKLWVDSHGRVDVMQLGAGAVQAALAQGHERGSGPVAIGHAMAALSAGRVTQ